METKTRKGRTLFSPLELKIVVIVWNALQWKHIIRIEIIVRIEIFLDFENIFYIHFLKSNNLLNY